ncbi:MAG: lipid A biosynthesis acyltransferase [Betaproteobacteria bacterium]|nr:lipid A biosynthesis acyltransferase [Betaproteobacteria bacterium]
MLTRLGFGVLWLAHFLPLRLLTAVGDFAGIVGYYLARSRRRIGRVNLALCFPELGPREREALLKRHFRAFGRSVFERGVMFWGSKARIQAMVQVEGIEHFLALKGQPVIVFAPHFVGVDMAAARLATEYRACAMYARQSDSIADEMLARGRNRFGNAVLFPRDEGLLPVLQAMKEGLPFLYSPDMDFGAPHSIFVPFFGVPAATTTGLSVIARVTRARVLPLVVAQRAGGDGYVARMLPPLADFPSADAESDTRRMNAFIEARILEMPEQYHWLHKRFKTRPAGEPDPYTRTRAAAAAS